MYAIKLDGDVYATFDLLSEAESFVLRHHLRSYGAIEIVRMDEEEIEVQ